MMNISSISDNWLLLGDIEEKIEFFDDELIPEVYRTEYGFFLRIQGERYYFKEYDLKSEYLGELLGEKVTLQMGLQSVHYTLAKGTYRGQECYGVLSKWARKNNFVYHTFPQMIQKNYQYKKVGLSILNELERTFPNEPINEEFRNFLAREYFTKEYDRISNEIIIETDGNHIHLGYCLDYEKEFQRLHTNIVLPFYYILDLTQDRTLCSIYQDERLIESFRKVLKINLEELLEEIKKEKLLRITSEEQMEMKNWQEGVKREIKKALSL